MTDWHSPLILQQNANSLLMLLFTLLGLYVWELINTLDFDISLIRGKRKFRWPMFFYLWARYGFLGCWIGIVVLWSTSTELNCRIGFPIAATLGHTGLSAASFTLCIRTIAVWNQDRRVVIPLILLSFGHFAVIIRSILNVDLEWTEDIGCTPKEVNTPWYIVMFGYTMGLDLIVMTLTAYKLWSSHMTGASLRPRSNGIAKLLFEDGLMYFVVAFLANLLALIFSAMNLNPHMALMADGPSLAFTSIVSGRVVRRLVIYNEKSTICLADLLPDHSRATGHRITHEESGGDGARTPRDIQFAAFPLTTSGHLGEGDHDLEDQPIHKHLKLQRL